MGFFVVTSIYGGSSYGSVAEYCSLESATKALREYNDFCVPGQITEVFEGTYEEALEKLASMAKQTRFVDKYGNLLTDGDRVCYIGEDQEDVKRIGFVKVEREKGVGTVLAMYRWNGTSEEFNHLVWHFDGKECEDIIKV